MWLYRTLYMILLIILSTQMTVCYGKGSLTYVIDNTLSMTDDIDQVKRNTDEITNIVFQQKASVIQNMVLVTVNDPYAFLEIATENRYDFKSKINGLHVHNDYGNPDCPEMSMTGILIALEKSLPRSFIYVFTDASAKDYSKSTEVKKKCQEKQSQIVFILTGDCWDFAETQFQVYYDIAAACPGLAIYIDKSDVTAIFEPIKDAIKDNKEMITSRTFPARTTVDVPFELTDDIEYATVTASGSQVILSVRSEPAHNEQRLSWINNLKVLRLTNITPGTYTATVYSTSVTTINIFGRSDFSFEHGFSGLEPKTLQDTLSHPIENISTQLFISVTDANHTVNILFLQILDMDEHIISTYDLPLKRISGDFYSTPSFIPPSSIFKIAVCGKAVNTGKKIRRLSRFPITPQKADKYLAPKLTGESSKSALIGTSTNIKCVITEGVPAPIISWQFRAKDKLEFVPLAGSNNELFISKVSEGDAGSYKCIARNIVGKAEHITVLIVQDPPTITSNTATIYKSIEGKDMELRLPCSTTGLPKPTITWSINQKTIQQSTKYLIEDGNLVIKNPSVDDTSTYKCTAKNDVGSVSASFQTEILHMPVITSDFSSIYKSIEGQDKELRIPCKATGIPKPIITWTSKQEIIKNCAKYFIDNGDLVINDPTVEDTSTYVCTATNEAGPVSASFQAEILRKPIITSDTSIIYKSIEAKDKVLRLPCKATGPPKPTITWALKQETIKPSTKYAYEDGDLIIRNPTMGDTSTYTCIAKNEAGSISASFQAQILHIPVITSDFSSIYKSIEGQDNELRIPCKATGIPKPIITWTRKQEIIKNSAKYFIDNGDLVINDPRVDDTSTYVCTATNEAGPVSASFQAEILRKPVITSDTSIIYKSIEAKDKVLRLPCKATGLPKPTITWTLKQETIKPSTKYAYEDGDLIIRNPTMGDTSTYTCIAENEAGSISASFQAQILRVPVITSDSTTVYYSIEDQDTVLKIPCRATGIPIPRITWSTNGRTIKPRAKHNFIDDNLLIRNPTVSDTATYVCTATNEAGSVSASFQAEIHQKPQISGKNMQAVRVTTPTSIKCLITKGVPIPTIAWEFMAKDKSDYVRLAGSENVFHISQVAVKDSGYYKCIASNIAGRAEHTTTLVVQVPPIITTDYSKPFTIVEGREKILEIPCAATGFPKPTLKWIKPNGVIIPNAKYAFKDGNLIIKNPSVSDTGTYFCVATNHAGKDRAIFHAVINQEPLISGNTSISVEVGTSAKITCTIEKGVPIPTITWFKAKIGSKYVRIPNSGTTLLIPSVREEDMGRYKCIAHNNVDDAAHITTLIITSVPKITNNHTEPYKGLEGDVALSIPCNAIGIPPPQISWFVNGTKITTNSHYAISRGALIIKVPTMIDTGSYKCEASNSMGSTQATFDVYVKEDLDDYGDIEVLKINALKQPTYKLECGSPGQSVKWFVDKEDIDLKGNYLELKYFDYDANYTCRVSDMHGAFTKTYRVLFGEAPKFQFDTEKDPYDWNGSNNDKLDCRVESENDTQVEWTYNGEILSDHTSLMLGVGGKWGQYTCNVSNGFGYIQRSFNVISSHCYVPSNPNEYSSMPLILTEQLNWPTFEYTENYFQLNPGDKIIFVCSKYGKDRNNFKILPTSNEITAICEKQDTLIVKGEPYKPTDLGCAHDFLPTVINEHKRCDKVYTESIQVGYDVSGFLESYKVCFDTSINMPLYSTVMMPNSYESVDLNKKWYRHPAIKYRTDNSVYTCKNSILRCCYSKTQLVSPSELPKGPAQSSTFIDTINAVPLWHPCDKPKSPWKDIEDRLSVQLPISPAEVIWSGIHTIQYNSGHLIPRYLFKFVKFIDDDPIAIIYVNGPSPTAADILCKNICVNGDIFWLEGLGSDVYCCHGDDFRARFNFNHYI